MNQTAKAAVFTGVGKPFSIREYPLTPPPAGMARLSLLASGVCGTDLHIHNGKIPLTPPAVIGHEFVGRVEELSDTCCSHGGDDGSVQVGDAVIVDIACPCGECALCKEGDDANCLHMGLTNAGNPDVPPHFYGGFAECNYSPVGNMIRIPRELDPKTACVYACAGPTALHAFRLASQAGFETGKTRVAVVQGLGPVGMFAVMALRAMGIPHVVAVASSRKEDRDRLARASGVTELFYLNDMPEETLIRKIRELNDGIGADLVFEASGNPHAFVQGLHMLRNRGMYLVPGQYSNSGAVEIPPQLITFNALHIIGSSQYSVSDVKEYVCFLQQHPELHPLISSLATCYPVSEINRAFEDAKAGKNIKTMLI